MGTSLRLRLFAGLAVVGLLAVAAVGFLASQTTRNEFQQYLESDVQSYQDLVSPLIISRIQAYIRQSSELEKLTPQEEADCLQNPIFCPPIDEALFHQMIRQTAQIAGGRIVVVSTEGMVVSDSAGKLRGNINSFEGFGDAAGALVVQKQAYLVYLDLSTDVRGDNELAFINAVNRSLLWASLIAALSAFFLGVLLSRSVLRPVKALNQAVKLITDGDLNQRVDTKGRDELSQLAASFNEMANSLSQVEKLRRNMVTDIAHELRTPLSNIRGYLEAIQDGLSEATPELIASLHEEALQLNRLIDDLQELALAEAGQLTLVREELDIHDLVDKTIKMNKPEAQSKNVSLNTDLESNLPKILADRGRMAQVLGNLLRNAITHTPSGGCVTISTRQQDGQVSLSVQDTGTGIPADDLNFVFERFYRADRSRTRSTGGAGLGLAIVKQLVEAHGGHVHAESTMNEGSTFQVDLPAITS